VLGEDEEPVEEDEDEEEKKAVKEEDLIFRENESEEVLLEMLRVYNGKALSVLEEFHAHLAQSEYINLKVSGLSPEERLDIVYERLGTEVHPLRPLAFQLEAGGLKDLLTQGLEESKVYRTWSPWQ